MPNAASCGEPLAYEVMGSGEPLLFLHGEHGPARSANFVKQAANYGRVIAPTLPGYGDSGRPSWLTTVDDVGFDLTEFLDIIGEPTVVLIGESLGGWIALDFASRYPCRVKALVVVNSMGVHAGTEEFADVFHLADEEVKERSFFGAPPETDDFTLQARADAMTARLGWHPRFHDPKLPFRLHRAVMPALVVVGDCDGIIPGACADRIASYLPNASRATLTDCAHFATWDQPEALSALVDGFLSSGEI